MKNKSTFMRVDKELLNKLKEKKVARGESYAEVVRRLIGDETNFDLKKVKNYLKKKKNKFANSTDIELMTGY